MKKIRLLLTILTISLLTLLAACSGSGDPISGSPDSSIPVIGLNTGGVSLDGCDIDRDDPDTVVSPGTSHLVTFTPIDGYEERQYTVQCSDGFWKTDGQISGPEITTMERSLEWVAPEYNCTVQFLFTPAEVEGDLRLGMMLVVSTDLHHSYAPPVPISRETTFVDPVSGLSGPAAAGELLVKLHDDAPITGVLNLRTAQDYSLLERVSASDSIFRLRFDETTDLVSVMSDLAQDERVETVEPNFLAYPVMLPDDPDYGKKHEFPTIDAELAWDITTGSSDVWVAVVDTGVDRDHPDLSANVVPGADFITGGDGIGGETPGDGADNNGDGIPDQNVGHGTHVAGIIGAMANNSVGACGIAPNTTILPLRIFPTNGDTGATFSSIIQAVEYASEQENVKVISMSIATSYQSSLLQSAINQAWIAGKVCVAAAANSDTNTMYYPAAHENCLAVAAINKSGEKASFSNYGTWVDISAPGTGIYSTCFDDIFAYMSGTSMATPLVSGCIALLFAQNPDLTNDQAVNFITTYTTDVYATNPEYIGLLGSGCVNPYLALNGMQHSQPVEVDDADSDGQDSNVGLEPGPSTQG